MAQSEWTHGCCDDCWPGWAVKIGRPGVEPTRLKTLLCEPCCLCGKPSLSGIYVRENPTSEILKCGGIHVY